MQFILPGNPVPKHRPRFSRTHACGTGHAYSDQSQEMAHLALLVRSQCGLVNPLTCPVSVKALFYMPIPKSLSNKRRLSLEGTPHYKRGDIDNFIKLALDVLVKAGNIIKDDSLVVEIHALKLYSQKPRTEIAIKEFIL